MSRSFKTLLVGSLLLSACSHTAVKTDGPTVTATESTEDAAPQESLARYLREQGMAYYQKSDYPRAISQFEAAALIAPDSNDTKSKYLLFYCYLSTGEYKKALDLSERIAKASPYQPLVYQQVGLAQFWLGQTNAAIANFLRASEFDSHSSKLHFYLGMAYQQIKQPEAADRAFAKAESEYLQVLKKNPKDFAANFELASLYLYWDKNIDAVPLLLNTAKLTLTPNHAEGDAPDEQNLFLSFYFPLTEGILQYRKNNASESLKTLYESFGNAPSGSRADLAEVYYYLGLDHKLLQDPDNAKQFLQQSLDLDPKGPFSGESQKAIRSLSSR